MREEEYLQCINFGFLHKDKIHNQTIPIVLAIDGDKKAELESSSKLLNGHCNGETSRHNGHANGDNHSNNSHRKRSVALKYGNEIVAILDNYEIFSHRKEERSAAVFKTTNVRHPSIQMIHSAGDWLIGGELRVLQRITWNDGLDQFRMTPREIRRKLQQMNVSNMIKTNTSNND